MWFYYIDTSAITSQPQANYAYVQLNCNPDYVFIIMLYWNVFLWINYLILLLMWSDLEKRSYGGGKKSTEYKD